MKPTPQKTSTPRPWFVDPTGDIGEWHIGCADYGIADCTYAESDEENFANAELICHAVNNFDALVEACRSIVRLGEGSGQMTHVIARAEAALKNARSAPSVVEGLKSDNASDSAKRKM